MSTELRFTVTYHAPFMAATGFATEGYDATVDLDEPLRADAIKGAMRSASASALGIAAARIDALFGSARHTCRWHWIVGETTYASARQIDKHRVMIQPDTHTAVTDQLQAARVGALVKTDFVVARSTESESVADERLILTLAARAVHGLGAQRRRGLGWVGITGGEDLSIDSTWAAAMKSVAAWRSA